MIELAHPQAINLFFYQDISSHFVNVALNPKLHIGVYLVWVATKGTSQTISLKDIQDCLLQGQAQLDQRAVFCFSILRLRSKKQYSLGVAHCRKRTFFSLFLEGGSEGVI